jgi:ADP-heptose:LPS heptosyltransferase
VAHGPHERRSAQASGPSEPGPGRRKVLIVRLGAIGDVTNALTLALALRGLPEPPFTGWVVHDLALPLVEGHPAVDRVHRWRRGSGVAGLAALVRELRAERYDVAVDLQRIAKSALVARLLSGSNPVRPRLFTYNEITR